MEEYDQATLAALPAILGYILNDREPPVDDPQDEQWLDAFEDARSLAIQFGERWPYSAV